jgi:hypothetical protein
MCKDFSCLVTQSRQAIWKRGLSSHDSIYSAFVDTVPELQSDRRYVKIEITPKNGDYLHPEKPWNFVVDEEEIPSWFTDEHKLAAKRAHRVWKKEVYDLINLDEARDPINPLAKLHKPTKRDIEALKQWATVGATVRATVWDTVWATVRDTVGATVWDTVWDTVRATVWDTVGATVWDTAWAYIGSLFYVWGDSYQFQSAIDLWKRGFVPSFDGTTWRLHSGPKAKIVYEWTPEK